MLANCICSDGPKHGKPQNLKFKQDREDMFNGIDYRIVAWCKRKVMVLLYCSNGKLK